MQNLDVTRFRPGGRVPVFGCALTLTLLAACSVRPAAPSAAPVILATTTSTYDSGLLDEIIPTFEREAGGMPVRTIAVGSGKALALAERGEADLLLVHAPNAEERFMAGGAGLLRRRMMYNDFVLVGPATDPAGLRRADDIVGAFAALRSSGATFVSRGDGSGTHEIELRLWQHSGQPVPTKRYVETGQGMGATLRVASEKGAYTLTDRGTFLSLQSTLRLEVLFEGDPALRNVYHLIVVNPKQGARVNHAGALALARFLLSEPTLARVRAFGRARYGRSLFVPDAEPFDIDAAASPRPGQAPRGGSDASHH